MQPSEEIKSKLDIVDVVREYVQLKAAGTNFRGLCPFHREKTPSFNVSPDKQIWHCFGCGKGGDIFSFIQEIEGVDFPEALRLLAPKAGVALKRYDPAQASQRNRALDMIELARRYYHKVLTDSPAAGPAREYLEKRGLSEETIEEWQIGYSPDTWDALSKFLRSKGYNDQEMFAAGLLSKSDTSNRFYDRFRGRIMFPVNDVNGQTVAFSARVSPQKEATEKMGKYINSPETQVYSKGRILFGLDKAKLAIKAQDLAILVEGQMDAISSHAAGFKNTIASSGTALTAEQVKLIKRFTNRVALAFDADQAGALAADRGVREAMKAEMDIRIIEVPSGKDPDDCIRSDPKEWERAVAGAQPMMEHYFSKVFRGLDPDKADDKKKAAKRLLPLIVQLGSPVEQGHWLRELSQRIDVKEEYLREAISRQAAPASGPAAAPEPSAAVGFGPRLSREEKASELLLALALRYPAHFNYLLDSVRIEALAGDGPKGIYRDLVLFYNISTQKQKESGAQAYYGIDYAAFRQWLSANDDPGKTMERTSQLKLLDKLAFLAEKEYPDLDDDRVKAELIVLNRLLKRSHLMAGRKETEKLIAEAERSGDRAAAAALSEQLMMLSEELKALGE